MDMDMDMDMDMAAARLVQDEDAQKAAAAKLQIQNTCRLLLPPSPTGDRRDMNPWMKLSLKPCGTLLKPCGTLLKRNAPSKVV